MSHIDFSLRELQRAWRESFSLYSSSLDVSTSLARSNTCRMVLFYCVECGLKAVYLKQHGFTSVGNKFAHIQHNLNQLLDELRAGSAYALPLNLVLETPAKQAPRNASSAQLNSVWRYGAKVSNPVDHDLERALLRVNEWIKGELLA